ncbi:hypothetical protein EAG_00620, partial [Camponotus floridanus]
FWRTVKNFKNLDGEDKYENVLKVVNFFFSLPFSNAIVERLFSVLKLVKTYKRNRIGSESLAGILCTREGIGNTGINSI